jgi:PKHD-type hydroxylase
MNNFTCMYYQQAMPPAFCDYVLNSLCWEDSAKGSVMYNGTNLQTDAIRQTDILSDNLMSPLGSVCKNYLVDGNVKGQWANSLCDFDLVQILRYTEGGHYRWHNDLLPVQNGTQRAASFVILLNDPSEFEGGLLQIKDKSDNLLKNKGDIVVFDSTAMHRVTPITKGVRYSAVCWARTSCEE